MVSPAARVATVSVLAASLHLGCAPTPEPLPCDVVGSTQGGEDLGALHRRYGGTLFVMGADVLSCGCGEGRGLAGDSEGRRLAGDNEARDLAGDSEARRLAGDSEARRLAGDDEARRLAGDSAPLMCVPDPPCGYRLRASTAYQVFDGYDLRWATPNECIDG